MNNTKGYDIGTVIDLRYLNKPKAVASRRRKFQALSEVFSEAEIQTLKQMLQGSGPALTA